MRLIPCISAKAAVQWAFQLGQVWSRMGQCFHSLQANVMLLHARACLVPVVDSGIGDKDLALLLFPHVDGKGEAGVNAGVEAGHVVIQIRLADLGVGVEDVHD